MVETARVEIMGKRAYTDLGGAGYAFLTTRWSLIDGVQANGDKHDALMDALLRQYWKPVYCYLRRKGFDNEQAKDLTQGFFYEIVIGRRLLQRAEPGKGRFRTFLLHALNQYVVDERTRQATCKRSPRGGFVSLDEKDLSAFPQMTSSMTPEDWYNYTWLSDMLERVLAEVEADCRSDGLDLHWAVFHDKLVQPILADSAPPSAAQICEKYGIDDQKRVSNMLITVKRRFEVAIRKHVRNTVTNDDQIDDEVRELFQYLP